MPEQVDIPALVERVREKYKWMRDTKITWAELHQNRELQDRIHESKKVLEDAAPVLADEVERLQSLVKQLELQVFNVWYTNRLAWSPRLNTQVYEFKCKTCGQVEERPSHRGYDPPMGCYRCHRNKQEQEAR